MKNEYEKICKYCGDPFTTSRANKEYCSPTHAKYDHEVRKGKRERPARQVNGSTYVPLSEIEISNRRSKVIELEKEILDLSKQISELKEEDALNNFENTNDYILELLKVKIRSTEKKNSLMSSIIDPNNIAGDNLKEYSESKTVYPFSEYERYDKVFESIGDQHQPFKAVISGFKEYGKTLFAIKIANHLIERLEAKVLYVCNVDQENFALKYTQYFGSLNHNFAFRVFNSELQIRHELKKNDYEFLIIDPISEFISHRQFFKDMKILYPRLSIIGTTRMIKEKLAGNFDVIFNVQNQIDNASAPEFQGVPISRGAFVNVYSKKKGLSQIQLNIFSHQYKNPLIEDSIETFYPKHF